MNKRAVLRLTGSLEAGFQVTLEVQENQTTFTEASAELPGNPDLLRSLEQWRKAYNRCVASQNSRISLESITVEPGPQTSLETCRKREKQLQERMGQWLAAELFRPVDQRLREALSPQEEAQLLLRSSDERLYQLPWQVWNIVERYPFTEIVFGSAPERVPPREDPSDRVRVLAILGDRRQINTDVDRDILQNLPQAEVTFLPEPSRREVDDQLWNQPWDILFFAGHSHSEGKCGRICLNAEESLTMEELRYGLKRAIAKGLQLAIFNSCDGLGIAYELEQLHVPQLVVMREPVPDQVAQEFLKYFLSAFSRGEALHLALREARERLYGLESNFPSPTWLPVLFQNPAVQPPTWQTLHHPPARPDAGGQSVAELPSVQGGSVATAGDFSSVTAAGAISSNPAGSLSPGNLSPNSLSPNSVLPSTIPSTTVTAPKLPKWLTSIWGVALGATFLTLGGRYVGMLQQPELRVFDHLLRTRPAEPVDERILVVTISEADILKQPEAERQGRSLSDQTLSQLLSRLSALGPRSIGLDLYREEPTTFQPLIDQFSNNLDLFAICKGNDPTSGTEAIPKPPAIPDDRAGFSGIRSDGDEIVRMQIFSAPIEETPCMDYSIALSLADDYLLKSGIDLTFSADGNRWQWQSAEFERIGASLINWPSRFFHYGPYAGINVQGHQFLLNYRASRRTSSASSPLLAFNQVSLTQVLEGSLQAADVEDKIVLIGVNLADRDRWLTPYRTEGKPLEVPGVFLHAQMASQILSAVLEGRPTLWAFPYWLDGVFVLFATSTSVWLLRRTQKVWVKVLLVVSSSVFLYVIAKALFAITGLYLPLLPSLAALGLAGLMLFTLALIARPFES